MRAPANLRCAQGGNSATGWFPIEEVVASGSSLFPGRRQWLPEHAEVWDVDVYADDVLWDDGDAIEFTQEDVTSTMLTKEGFALAESDKIAKLDILVGVIQ